MEPAEYDYMFQLEDNLWWYVGMRRIIAALIRRYLPANGRRLQVLDAGAGTGGSLGLLKHFGDVTAFDFSPRAAELYARRERGRVAVASVEAIPFADASFDLVTSFEVLCQVPPPEDETALGEMLRVLKPGGGLVLRVPAFQWLYGPHDVAVHTKHRYSAREVSAKLEKAGFRLTGLTYANGLLFPLAVARRALARLRRSDAIPESDVRPMAAPLNRALTAILSAEALLLTRVRLPFGLSIVAVARKP